MTIEKLYGAEEIAEVLSINKQTVLRFIREGKIKALKVGREYRIQKSALQEYLKLDEIDNVECKCVDPICAKCILINCKDPNCKVHSESKKKEFREIYNNR